MPDQDGKLACRRDGSNVLPAPALHAQKETAQRARAARCDPARLDQHVARGGHVTRSGSQPRVCRRPARTFVLPTPRVPDGLTITRFAEEAADTKAPKSLCRIADPLIRPHHSCAEP